MTRKRNQHSSEFKAKVAIEALKDQNALAEMASSTTFIPTRLQNGRKNSL
jgi:hypothetical protein